MAGSMIEEIVALMNAYPPLWFLYVLLLILPFVVVISYLFWPKDRDSVAYRKKTDAPSPDDKYKEEVRDSGIEASGETEQESVRERPSSNLGPVSQVNDKKAESTENPEEDQHELSQEEEQVPHQNGVIAENSDVVVVHSERGIQNGIVEHLDSPEELLENGDLEDEVEILQEQEEEEEEEDFEQRRRKRWSFPPILDEFDLMATEKDPTELEEIFSDERLKEITLRIEEGGPGIGITIVGGTNSPNGDLPMLIKRIIPGSLAEQEGTIKPGDELIAVNETLLAGVDKDYAARALSRVEGEVRLLILQDD